MRFSLIYTMILTAQCSIMVRDNRMEEAPASHLINYASAVMENSELAAPMGSANVMMGNTEPRESKLYCKDAVEDIGNCCILPKLIPELEQMKCKSFVEETRDAYRVRHAIGPVSVDNPFRGGIGMKPEHPPGEPQEHYPHETANEEPEKEVEEEVEVEEEEEKNDKDDNEDSDDSEDSDDDDEEKAPLRKGRSAEENEDEDIKTVYSSPPKVPRIMSTKEGKIDYDAVTKFFKENSESAWHGHIGQAVMDCRDGVISATCSQKMKRVEMCQPFMIPPPRITARRPTFNTLQKLPEGGVSVGFPGDPPSMNDGEGVVHTMMSEAERPIYQAPIDSPEMMMPIMAPGISRSGGKIQPNFRPAIMTKNANVQNRKVFKNNKDLDGNMNRDQKYMNQGPMNFNQGNRKRNEGQNGKKQGQGQGSLLVGNRNMNENQKGKNQGQNIMNQSHRNLNEGQKGKKQGQNIMTNGQRNVNDGQKDKNQGQSDKNQGSKQPQNGRDGKLASRDGTNKASLDKVLGSKVQDKPMGEKDLKKNAGNPQLEYVKMSSPGGASNKSGKRKSILSNNNGPRDT
ncbi:hypothetical protein B566_EDAN009469 [Ephemera danica]|nr:hypothetical protein B566_EDAN009469 [Ephemera danica]